LNLEFFIAKRIFSSGEKKKSISQAIAKISVAGIALGLAVMILAVAIVTGFQEQIREKVIGFGSHFVILNYDSNNSYQTIPIRKNQPFCAEIAKQQGIKHIQVFALKAGIIKTDNDIQGVVLKGVDSDYDWEFFNKNIVRGTNFTVSEGETTNKIIISNTLSKKLRIDVGDEITIYFVQEKPRVRKFEICGIFDTSLEEYDKLFVIVDIQHIQRLEGWEKDQVSGFEILIDNFNNIDEMQEILMQATATTFTEDGGLLRVRSIKETNQDIFNWLELTDTNVWVILILMVIVAGFQMISGLLILILERTNMVGILISLGMSNLSVRKIFLYNTSFIIAKGLFWGNIIGISLALLQLHFSFIKLDPVSYYMTAVPINIKLWHVLLLNAGTLLSTVAMLIVPSFVITRIKPAEAVKYN